MGNESTKYKLYADQVALELWIHGNIEAATRAMEGKVCSKTITRWLDKSEFVEKIQQKGAEVEKKCFASIMNDSSWQSKAWILERRKSDKYSIKNKTEVTGADGTLLKIIFGEREITKED